MTISHERIKQIEAEGQARHDADLAKARQSPKMDQPASGAALLMADPSNNSSGQFSWADTSSTLRDKCIRVVNAAGNAISFAENRAHTGGSCTILAGVISPKLLAEGLDEANEVLRRILVAYGASIPE